MGAKDDSNPDDFLQKFNSTLNLLKAFCAKPKASFSENVSFLLDKALDHLKKQEADVAHMALIRSTVLKNFFSETLTVTRAPVVHPPIIIFSIKLFTELSNNEERFHLMSAESGSIFPALKKLTETTIVENSEVKQAFLGLFLSLSKFKSGQEWLWTSGTLVFIGECLSDRTIFTRKTAQDLMHVVLPIMDPKQRQTILTGLLAPILQAGSKLDHQQIECDRLRPYFEVLESYMEDCLSSANQAEQLDAELSSADVEQALMNVVRSAENEKLLSQGGSLLSAIYAKRASESSSSEQVTYQEKTMKLIQLILRRGFLRSTLNVTCQSLYHWSQLDACKEFQVQLVCIMMVPVMVDNEEVADHFPCYTNLTQFWKDTARGTTCFVVDSLVTMLRSNGQLNELTGIVLAGLRKSINKFGKDFALKVTRSCLYLLGCLKRPGSKRTVNLSSTPQLAVHLTKSLCAFVDIYNIQWWESYETICLPVLFTRLVAHSANRDTQVACAGLEGLKFCIQQFLHPDQALLLQASPESTLNEAADVLHRCTVSINWEIRDSAMEVVLEMTLLAHTRYPAFQQLLISSGLLKAALSAFNDTEAYVRASAIAVVAAATRVPSLWEHMMEQEDVIGSCYAVLGNDSEALARRAAAKALTLIAQSSHFPMDQDRAILYRNMAAAASDLDWEVKLQALEFWRAIIDEALTQQGMLDGIFPEFIFSAEKQKIVKLNATEIRTRLQKVLAHLGGSGCLQVLLHLADDCDAPVKEKSIQLLSQLRDLLAKHEALDLSIWPAGHSNHHQPVPSRPTADWNNSVPNETLEKAKDADQIIEEILSVDDVNLVAGILKTNTDQSSPAPNREHLQDNPPPLNARDFVNQINLMELESMLQVTGLSSDLHVNDFDSLLDDLQDCIHTDTSRPRPDCY